MKNKHQLLKSNNIFRLSIILLLIINIILLSIQIFKTKQEVNAVAGTISIGSTTGGDLSFPGGLWDHNGKVGIANTAPGSMLQIGPDNITDDNVAIETSNNSGTGVYGQGYGYGINANAYYGYGLYSGQTITGYGGTYGVYGSSSYGIGGYFSSTSGYALTTMGGNVGFGTATPVDLLDVEGSIRTQLNVAFPEQGSDPSAAAAGTAREWYRGSMWVEDDSSTAAHNLLVDDFGFSTINLAKSVSGTTNWYMNWNVMNDAATTYVENFVSSPKGWDGKTVYVDVFWMADETGNVRWLLQTRPFKDNDYAFTTTTDYYLTTASTSNGSNPPITRTGFTITWPTGYDMVNIYISRLGSDGADTLTDPVYLKSVRIRVYN